ncbi:High-affinity branched-chain amino acid transport system permease protein LivH (TC 3.A.1.4.1) [Olavius algarvensis Delta 1 endosymbiont]|nr:High-affinity branched-chain amino acid transport system permease protein LivH (TC 3.A.1.4.1) [Olavius algarvensis Delta 1 endosymbiont]
MSIEVAIQQMINALSLGSLYAMLALGLAMVFSVLGLLNFAYGELVTVCGYTMYLLILNEVPFFAAGIGGLVVAVAVSLLTERVVFRPLRGASFITLLFSSFAAAVIIQNLIRQIISKRPKVIPVPQIFDDVIQLGPFQIGVLPLITVLVGLVTLTILISFLQKTRWGLAIRAAAEDFEVTRLMGARANRIIALSFALSGFVAGVAGFLWLARRGAVSPSMGFVPILKAFIAVVIGGLGSLKGSVIGGFVLAFIEISLIVVLPTSIVPFTDALALVVVVAILYFKPRGLFSVHEEISG